VAAEVARRHGLVPPIDIRRVVEEFADVETALIPGDCDGLVVGLHGPRPRPLVIVHSGQIPVRQRFTLAHELGHILLPWHLGEGVVCQTGHFMDDPSAGGDAEPEANRFASELLIPSEWLASLMGDHPPTTAAGLTDALLAANVSTWVACLRLRDTLPSGFVFAMVDEGEVVILSGQTVGTSVQPPPRDRILEASRYDQFAQNREVVSVASRRIIWWTFLGRDDALVVNDDPRSSRELLAALLARHVPDPDGADRVTMSLAGVIGSANGDAVRAGATSAGELVVRFRGRFAKQRDLPDPLLEDQEFELWIRKRASELAR
jgi:hypothetical protein